MRKTMMVLGVLLCATLLVNPAMACDGKDAKQASNEGASCSKSAARATSTVTAASTASGSTSARTPTAPPEATSAAPAR